MSADCPAMKIQARDVRMLLACHSHRGTTDSVKEMEQYIFKANRKGVFIFHMRKQWEKLMLAARILVTIQNPADILVCSSRAQSERAIRKFTEDIGATPVIGRFVPGTFTNFIQKDYREPCLMVVTDPRADSQAIKEATYANVPVIALCNTDTPLKGIDIAIPINNKGPRSIGLAYYVMAREVLRLRGDFPRTSHWKRLDHYFYISPSDMQKIKQKWRRREMWEKRKAKGKERAEIEPAVAVDDWAAESETPAAGLGPSKLEDWASQPVVEDWSAQTGDWGGAGSDNWA